MLKREYALKRGMFVLGLVAVLALALAACGSSDSSSSSADSSGASTGSAAGKNVVLLTCAASNPWCKTFNDEIVSGVEGAGANVETLENNFDTAVQIQQFNQAIAKKPDLILLEATDSKSIVPSILKAKQADIPVINLDGRAEDAAVPGLTSQILADNPLLGQYAAENVVDGLKEIGLDSGNVIAITGTKASTITTDRMEGWNKVMDQHPEYKVVAVEDGNWDPVQSGKVAQELFAKYASQGGIQAAYGMADYQAVPIIQAAKQAGLKVGAADKGLIVTGSNCTKAGIDAIKAGTLFGTATEDPVNQGKDTAASAVKFLEGETLPPIILTPQAKVRKDNVEKYAADCSKS